MVGAEVGFDLKDEDVDVFFVSLEEVDGVGALADDYLHVFGGEELYEAIVDYVVVTKLKRHVQDAGEGWQLRLRLLYQLLGYAVQLLLVAYCERSQPRVALS